MITGDFTRQNFSDWLINGIARRTENDASGLPLYIGFARAGTASGVPAWAICRITRDATTETVEWANGNTEYSNSWDSRASLTYS